MSPAPGQRTPMRFPHPTAPSEQVTQQPQAAVPQAQQPKVTPEVPATQAPAVQAVQQPSGAEQRPANPPRISFVGGLLTVAAENSTLADILKSIETVTHASLEGTQPDAERVFGQFGPGAPRQVLNSILSGSHYDFILVGGVDDPGSVERIMLSQHGTAPAVRGAGQMAARQNVPTPNNEQEDNDVAEQPQIQQQSPPAPVPSEQVQPPGGQQQVKTPEQLLQELQRLRQQQQQQQPQQAPGNNPR
jgi:hypothetical protein